MPDFYKRLKYPQIENFPSLCLTDGDYEEIIRRCRLLRNLKYDLAVKMISAMWLAIDDLLSKERPDIVLSFTIDYYALDILERISSRRGIPFYGLMSSILRDKLMISARGEYNQLYDSNDEQVTQALNEMTADEFAPFLSKNPKYSLGRFWSINLRFILRSHIFWILRHITRDPMNSHFLMTRLHVSEYRTGLEDRNVVKYFDNNWENKVKGVPTDKRVFIGLQQNPEASIDYWVHNIELIDYEAVLHRLIDSLSVEGFTILIKDHPNMFALRKLGLIKGLQGKPNTIMLPYEARSQHLVRECGFTFTWTGTIGLQAALAGNCAIVTNPYYATEEEFLIIRNLKDIDLIPHKLSSRKREDYMGPIREKLAKRVSDGSLPGSLLAHYWLRFSMGEAEKVNQIKTVARSLSKYFRTR